MDDYFKQFFNYDTSTNYPPYNHIHINNVDSLLEIALAGFSKRRSMYIPNTEDLLLRERKRRKRAIRVCP